MRTAIFAFATVVAMSGSVLAATVENFQVNSAKDLVKLCSVQPDDPDYVAAIHFCHGFVIGAYPAEMREG